MGAKVVMSCSQSHFFVVENEKLGRNLSGTLGEAWKDACRISARLFQCRGWAWRVVESEEGGRTSLQT